MIIDARYDKFTSCKLFEVVNTEDYNGLIEHLPRHFPGKQI